MLHSLLYRHREEIERFARVMVGEEARKWRLVVCEAGRDGNASVPLAVLVQYARLSQKMTRPRQVSVYANSRHFRMGFDLRGRKSPNKNKSR